MTADFLRVLSVNHNINLTDQQVRAVWHQSGPALVLAVPGSGKTTCIVCRTANLILEQGVNPREILTVTFNKAAAVEMAGRFRRLFEAMLPAAAQVHFSTIHSLAYEITRESLTGQGINFRVIEGENGAGDRLTLLRRLYIQFNQAYPGEEILETLANDISYVKNKLLSAAEHDSTVDSFVAIFGEYEAAKEQAEPRQLDFDDMLTIARAALAEDRVLEARYRGRFTHIQVDEGQDVSPVQYEIIRRLAGPRQNLFIVADDDQSIYGFRGASPRYLLDIRLDFPDVQILTMDENFRSTVNIINPAGKVIEHNRQRYRKTLRTNNPLGKEIALVRPGDEKEQSVYVLQQLQPSGGDGAAIIYRYHASAVALADRLERKGIPFALRDYQRHHFFTHWLTMDILAFINLAIYETNVAALERIYYKTRLFLKKPVMQYVREHYQSGAVLPVLLDCPLLSPAQRSAGREFGRDLNKLAGLPPAAAVLWVEERLGYQDYLKRRYPGGLPAPVSLTLSTLKQMAADAPTMAELKNRLVVLARAMDNARQGSGVVLSSIHGVKGLEFDQVFMVHLMDGFFPSGESAAQKEQGKRESYEEERRLFYVGMTRARHDLHLIAPQRCNGERVGVSAFFRETERAMGELGWRPARAVGETDGSDAALASGTAVRHVKFGSGRVISVLGDIMVIDFDGSGLKKLSREFCTRNGYLEATGE